MKAKKRMGLVLGVILVMFWNIGCPTEPVKPVVTQIWTLQSIEVMRNPAKTNYRVGDNADAIDLAGIRVEGVYEDQFGTIERRNVPEDTLEIEGFDASTVGSKLLTLKAEEFTAQFTVMVNDQYVTLAGVEITPPARVYYKPAEEVSWEGFKFTAQYDNKTTQDIEREELLMTAFNPESLDNQTIKCEWGGQVGQFDMAVVKTLKLMKNGKRMINTSWNEQGFDPRNHLNYVLDDGKDTLYFDHVVILYGFRLRDKDCSADASIPYCNQTGLHLCYMPQFYNICIENYDTYIKPLQDAGIKVSMCIVPNDDGVAMGTLYRWPMEKAWSWTSNYSVAEYDYNEKVVKEKIINYLADLLKRCPFDGIAFDDEYGNRKEGGPGRGQVYPEGVYGGMSGFNVSESYRIGGENILRFCHDLNKAVGKKLVYECYEWKYDGNIPASYNHPTDGMIYRDDLITLSYEPTYGGWQQDSGNNLPREKYGPASIDLGFAGATALPPGGPNGSLASKQNDILRMGYGVQMFYCLRSAKHYAEKRAKYFLPYTTLPEYLSEITQILFGYNVKFIGEDYWQDIRATYDPAYVGQVDS